MTGVSQAPGRDLVVRTSFSNLAVLWGIFGMVAAGALIWGAIDPTRAAAAAFLAWLSVVAGVALTVLIRATTRMELRAGRLIVCPIDRRTRLRPYVQIKLSDIVSVSVDRFVMRIVDRDLGSTDTQVTSFSRADVLRLLSALDQFGIPTKAGFERT